MNSCKRAYKLREKQMAFASNQITYSANDLFIHSLAHQFGKSGDHNKLKQYTCKFQK